MEVIYENPQKEFTIRELEKKSGLPRATISEYLKQMKNGGLLDRDSLFFKIKKTNYYIEKIVKSGLVDFLIKELNPFCIILFGSIRKGESEKESDIDIFVETPHLDKEMNLTLYEKRLKHSIQLHIEGDLNKLPDNLFNNIINGIKLYGSFKVK